MEKATQLTGWCIYLFICGLIDDFSSLDFIVWNKRLSREELFGRDVVVAWIEIAYYPDIGMEGSRKTMKKVRMVCIRAEIGTQHLPNAKWEF